MRLRLGADAESRSEDKRADVTLASSKRRSSKGQGSVAGGESVGKRTGTQHHSGGGSGTYTGTHHGGHQSNALGVFVPGSRIMYGSWVALENSNGKFLCLHRRGNKLVAKPGDNATQPPWGNDVVRMGCVHC